MDLGFHSTFGYEENVEGDKWWENSPKGDGSVCFFDQAKLQETKSMALVEMVTSFISFDERLFKVKVEKGGWLTKRGHKVKNMKRR